ncbi:lytic transglycosylase [Thiocapsa imhoffii]|uniref:Lytic transglycosylase n=1 Tax=Thiocapsa imhoffii TaxID=382777 RepID=A0A9X1B969_9GAMM|nr:lytic transglycosylase domain-containing protein [Thiocapsa imhoffii]MBK1644736.1 lytic transglycosylase [Thiocapsa imhoffii]
MRNHCHPSLLLPVILLLITLIGLAGCSSQGDSRDGTSHSSTRLGSYQISSSEFFPVPAEIQPNVDFWRHVYGIWGRGEVAIHDNEHMGVVYEVVKLPDPILEGYTDSQRQLIRSRTSAYKDQLSAVEARVRAGQTLTSTDRALLEKLERAGGSGAIYGASDRVRSQRGLRERFRRGVEISGRYDPHFREIMRQHGVPEDLAYLPHVESSFQTNARSSVGAAGVWQFMPATGRMFMSVNDTIDERFDPIIAADAAARYLAQAHRRLGSWPLAITSYNHGQGGMANAKAQFGDDIGRIVQQYKGPYFGFASRNFYAEFIAAREVTRNAKRYFPEGISPEQPWAHDRLVLQHGMPVTHLASHYGVSSRQLAELNLHWRDRVREGRANLPSGTTIWLPAGTKQRVASHPPPVSHSMIARATPQAAPAPARPAVTQAKQSTVKATTTTKTTSNVARATTASTAKPAASKPRYHVVKPQETLYRVAVENGLTVDELRRLNKISPTDNNIRPGQKLKVSS